MFEKSLTQAQLADELGCSSTFASMLCRGEKMPGRALANAIERITADWSEGPIRSEDWDEFEASQKHQRPRKALAQ